MIINIEKADKAAVLAALYNASRPQGMGIFQAVDGNMSLEQAQKIVAEHEQKHWGLSFDYVYGRPLKVTLDENPLRVDLYERDNGHGTALRVLRDIPGVEVMVPEAQSA